MERAMNTPIVTGALIVLLSGSTFAQQTQMPGGQPEVPPPLLAQEALDAAETATPWERGRCRDPRPMGAEAGDQHGQEHHRRGSGAWEDHRGFEGPGWGGGRGGGAVIRFNREGGPSIAIDCASPDSTLECINAIMPMLGRMLP